jgi:hypothetical protein
MVIRFRYAEFTPQLLLRGCALRDRIRQENNATAFQELPEYRS